jgi:microcystin-dependent protein
MTTTIIPIGCLVMFGGGLEGVRIDELRAQGWLLCDGTPYPAGGEYEALFDRIGANYGGDDQTFNVPDFRGRFSRGTDHGRGADPDTAGRIALNRGGNTGDKVGSAQPYATGLPVNQFHTAEAGEHQHDAPHLSHTYHNTSKAIWTETCMEWSSDAQNTSEAGDHSHMVTGGDSESRPVNVYAHYLIKFKNAAVAASAAGLASPSPQAIPVGTVLLFAGDAANPDIASQLRSEGWLPCFGQTLEPAEYQGLFDVVQLFFGGTEEGFKLPDLRGQFVRGASAYAEQGHGAAIGTSQSYTTMRPLHPIETKGDSLLEVATAGGHGHTLKYLPQTERRSYYVAGFETAEYGGADTKVDWAGLHWHAVDGGGDRESRPINVYVDFIIKFAEPAAQ